MRHWILIGWIGAMALAAGCEDDEDGSRRGRDYLAPPGFGAILVENSSRSEWNVRIDETYRGRVDTDSFMLVDALPGPHPVHLDEHHGSEIRDRAVFVEEGLNSVLRINDDDNGHDYDLDQFLVAP